MSTRPIRFNAFDMSCVGHISSGLWRHPDDQAHRYTDISYWTELAKLLEQGRFDGIFIADVLGTYDVYGGTADAATIEAFASAILALDDSVPTGTYVDMCSKLPVNNPENIKVPTLIMRGQWDGIAGFDDLIEFFKRLPNPDKQFTVMPGISHASFQQKNYMLVYHILLGFFAQPEPVYRG